jgi:hypothetical protein
MRNLPIVLSTLPYVMATEIVCWIITVTVLRRVTDDAHRYFAADHAQ